MRAGSPRGGDALVLQGEHDSWQQGRKTRTPSGSPVLGHQASVVFRQLALASRNKPWLRETKLMGARHESAPASA